MASTPEAVLGLKGLSSVQELKIDDAASSTDSALLTTGSGRALRYDFSDQTVLHSWFAPSYLALTTPVFELSKEEYGCVLNGHKLVTWAKGDKESKLERLVKEHAVDLSSKAISVVKDAADEAFLVYDNGDVQSARAVQRGRIHDVDTAKGRKALQRFEDAKIVKSSFVKGKGGSTIPHIAHAFSPSSDPRVVSAALFKLHDSELEPASDLSDKKVGCHLTRVGETLVGKNVECFDFHGDSLVIVDSDLQLKIKSLHDGGETTLDTLSNYEENCSKSICVKTVDKDFVAVFGPKKNTTDADKSLLLSIYNTNFLTLVHSTDVSISSPIDGKLSMVTFGQKLIFQFGSKVGTLNCGGLPRSLDALVGLSSLRLTTSPKEEKNKKKDNRGERGNKSQNGKSSIYNTLSSIFKHDDVVKLAKLIDDCLPSAKRDRGLVDLPEVGVLSVIEYLFTIDESILQPLVEAGERNLKLTFMSSKTKASPNENCWPSSRERIREKMLLATFEIPVTESVIFPLVAKLRRKSVLRILKFLNLALKVEDAAILNYDKYSAWIGFCINAHYADLVRVAKFDKAEEEENEDGNDDVAALIKDLNETVRSFEATLASLAALMPHVKLVQKKTYGVQKRNFARNSSYCVEVIEL